MGLIGTKPTAIWVPAEVSERVFGQVPEQLAHVGERLERHHAGNDYSPGIPWAALPADQEPACTLHADGADAGRHPIGRRQARAEDDELPVKFND